MDNIPFKNNDIMKLGEKFGDDDKKKKRKQDIDYTDMRGRTYSGTKTKGLFGGSKIEVSHPNYGSLYIKERGNKMKVIERDTSGNVIYKDVVRPTRQKKKYLKN